MVVAAALTMSGCSSDGDPDGGRAGDPGTRPSDLVSLTPITELPGPDPDGPPTTYDEAVAHVESASGNRALDAFQSPSGNLHCRFERTDPYGVSCELLEGRVKPAAGDKCPSVVGVKTVGRIEMQGASLRAVCNTDTIIDPADEVLAYGQAVVAGRFSCIIEEIGVTCVAADDQRGFFLARGVYRLFR